MYENFTVESHLAFGMDCRGRSWMVTEGRWRCCCHFPASLGSCLPVNWGKWRALCWPEWRILGRSHSAACAAHSVVEGCESEAALNAWRWTRCSAVPTLGAALKMEKDMGMVKTGKALMHRQFFNQNVFYNVYSFFKNHTRLISQTKHMIESFKALIEHCLTGNPLSTDLIRLSAFFFPFWWQLGDIIP